MKARTQSICDPSLLHLSHVTLCEASWIPALHTNGAHILQPSSICQVTSCLYIWSACFVFFLYQASTETTVYSASLSDYIMLILYTHIYTHRHVHKQPHTYTHKQTHTHIQMHLHTDTRRHTQAYTHTHKYTLSVVKLPPFDSHCLLCF